LFDGFALERVDVGGVGLRVRHGGSGPPVLLVHGHPRTHATWHRVAGRLAEEFTVVCPDLRGYGRSDKPATTPDHAPYAKRAMAADLVELMRILGHSRFVVAGHDRGCYVATRLALDHPRAVAGLVPMDGIPIGEALARAGAEFAGLWWHWFFLGQTAKPAEPLISADPDRWYGPGDPEHMGREAWEDYRAAIHDPATVHAMCEDYRAGLGIDRAHDDADRAAGRRVACPVHVLWSTGDDMADLYGDIRDIWRTWADGPVTGGPVESGHHMAEDAPGDVAAEIADFARRVFAAEVGGVTGARGVPGVPGIPEAPGEDAPPGVDGRR
jgi:haloacetate dehalogenase